MFGYVKPFVPELKVKENELYKSTYCGLCKVMGKKYSFFYKMSLSYDYVFFILLRLLLTQEKPSFSKCRCIAHPTKKKPFMNENKAIDCACDIGVLLLYYNLLDKIADKDSKKYILSKLCLPFIKHARKKALKNNKSLSETDEFIKNKLSELAEVENSGLDSIDKPAEIFGEILGKSMSICLEESQKRIAEEIGICVGKWIYITDALDDAPSDEKNKKYNPFLSVYNSTEDIKTHKESIVFSLCAMLSRADKALDIITEGDRGIFSILQNIIDMGLPSVHNKILKEKYQ